MEGKVVHKIHELGKKYQKPIIIVSGINKLTDDELKKWREDYGNFEIYDLVSNFGISDSLRKTEDCLKQISDSSLIPKLKDILF